MSTSTYEWRIRDVSDNGEFLAFATLDLVADGEAVETVEFSASSEFPGESATEQAVSYGEAWVEANTYTLEERLGPFGLEWQREWEERRQGR